MCKVTVLEEIKVPPATLALVITWGLTAADGAGQFNGRIELEVNVNLTFLQVKVHVADLPWRLNPQELRVKVFVSHAPILYG